MKKENAKRLKRIIAALTITAALGLPVAAQDRSGYVTSEGKSGYVSSEGRSGSTLGSGRTEDTSTTQSADEGSGVFMGSGTRTDGMSTTQTTDDNLLITVWSWMSSLI